MKLDQQRLVDAVKGVMSAQTSLAGALVQGRRRRPVPTEVDRVVSVSIVRSESSQIVTGPLDWTTLLGIEYLARCGADTEPDDAVGDLVAWGHAALMDADAALHAQGFVVYPTCSLVFGEDESGERAGVCTAIYMVKHRTDFNNLIY